MPAKVGGSRMGRSGHENYERSHVTPRGTIGETGKPGLDSHAKSWEGMAQRSDISCTTIARN